MSLQVRLRRFFRPAEQKPFHQIRRDDVRHAEAELKNDHLGKLDLEHAFNPGAEVFQKVAHDRLPRSQMRSDHSCSLPLTNYHCRGLRELMGVILRCVWAHERRELLLWVVHTLEIPAWYDRAGHPALMG